MPASLVATGRMTARQDLDPAVKGRRVPSSCSGVNTRPRRRLERRSRIGGRKCSPTDGQRKTER